MGAKSCVSFALVAVLGAAIGTARAGTIVGSIPLRPADLAIYAPPGPNPYMGHMGAANAHRAAASDTTFGVAYISDLLEAGDEPPPPALLDQIGERFEPRILAVVAGQTVVFRNSDNVYHNIFSYSPPKRFDLGRYPKGQSRSLPFPKPGSVQIYCDIHSHMRADLLVVPSPYFAYVNGGGRFCIQSVPPGLHTVVVWLPTGEERRGDVRVPEAGTVEAQPLAP